MTSENAVAVVKIGFEPASLRLAIADIQPLRLVSQAVKKSKKYAQIRASIQEVGLIEPPVVARNRTVQGKYLLLDGHIRVEALKDMGETEVVCLVSTDDEAFTYNKHVSRLAPVQEHRMIVKAVERGVPEKRIAKALDVDVRTLQIKIQLLDGICPEAVDLLKDKHVPQNTFRTLKKMVPLRQIEAAEFMIAMNNYTTNNANSILAATPQAQLTEPHKPKRVKGLTEDQMALMERESANLDREYKVIEQSYSADYLDLVVANAFLGKLLSNALVVRYLAQHHEEILSEFRKIVDAGKAAA